MLRVNILPNVRIASGKIFKQCTAWKSTIVEAECPVTGAKSQSSRNKSSADGRPQFHKVPAYPVVGSMIPQLSGIPMEMKGGNVYTFWPAMKEKFGEFYTMGLPVVGKGLTGELLVIQDPQAMMDLIRREGIYPSGSAQNSWAFREILNGIGLGQLSGLFSQGPEWKLVRSFLQTDLFSPKSAKRYVPSIIEAADNCSKAAGHYQNDLKVFLDYASFEMFCSIMFGRQLNIVDPTKERDPAALSFAQTVVKALSASSELNKNVAAYALKTALNYENAMYSEAKGYWKTSMEIANSIVDDFVARRDRGELTEGEEASYLNQALIRQAEQDQEKEGLTFDEVKMSCAGLLSAGVDTTSGMMTWFVLHVAMNPHVQQRLREELQANLVNGKLTQDSLSSSKTPYLYAVTRESHRLTSPIPTHVFRIIPENFEVHGRSFPEKTVVCFDGYSKGVDPEIVDDPLTFNPDRWMPEVVDARKGTPAEVIDHPLFSLPFGQGARRCPGSRVARNEGHIMLAQLVLDWEMTTPSVKHWTDVPYGQATLTVPMPMPHIEMTPLFK